MVVMGTGQSIRVETASMEEGRIMRRQELIVGHARAIKSERHNRMNR
jgi:hypothetical protein